MIHEIKLAWVPVPGATSYNIYRGTAIGNESAIPYATAVVASYVDTNVFQGKVYSYEVTAVINGIESTDSNQILSAPVPFPLSPATLNVDGAASFEILAGSTITNTGPSTVAGDVGVSPGTSITGFPPGIISGVFHNGDFVALAAQNSLTAAFVQAASAQNPTGVGPVLPASGPFIVTSCTTGTSGVTLYTGTFLPGLSGGLVGQDFAITGFTNAQNNGTYHCTQSTITTLLLTNPNGTAETATASASGLASNGTGQIPLPADLTGMVLTAGVYNAPSSLALTGSMDFDAQGDTNAVFIVNIGSTLTTASGSTVELLNGAQSSNIFWVVGSSATLGTNSTFKGTLLAQASITVTTGANVIGKLLAHTGAVTLDTNVIDEFILFGFVTPLASCIHAAYQPGDYTVIGPLPSSPPNVPPPPPPAPTGLTITLEQ